MHIRLASVRFAGSRRLSTADVTTPSAGYDPAATTLAIAASEVAQTHLDVAAAACLPLPDWECRSNRKTSSLDTRVDVKFACHMTPLLDAPR